MQIVKQNGIKMQISRKKKNVDIYWTERKEFRGSIRRVMKTSRYFRGRVTASLWCGDPTRAGGRVIRILMQLPSFLHFGCPFPISLLRVMGSPDSFGFASA